MSIERIPGSGLWCTSPAAVGGVLSAENQQLHQCWCPTYDKEWKHTLKHTNARRKNAIFYKQKLASFCIIPSLKYRYICNAFHATLDKVVWIKCSHISQCKWKKLIAISSCTCLIYSCMTVFYILMFTIKLHCTT